MHDTVNKVQQQCWWSRMLSPFLSLVDDINAGRGRTKNAGTRSRHASSPQGTEPGSRANGSQEWLTSSNTGHYPTEDLSKVSWVFEAPNAVGLLGLGRLLGYWESNPWLLSAQTGESAMLPLHHPNFEIDLWEELSRMGAAVG